MCGASTINVRNKKVREIENNLTIVKVGKDHFETITIKNWKRNVYLPRCAMSPIFVLSTVFHQRARHHNR